MSEATQAVLGSMVLDNECIAEVAEKLSQATGGKPADVFDDIKEGQLWDKDIYNAILSLHDQGSTVDLLTLRNKLQSDGKDIDTNYLVRVAEAVPSSASANYYADIAIEAYRSRQVTCLAQDLTRISQGLETASEKVVAADKAFRARTEFDGEEGGPKHTADIKCSFEPDSNEYLQTQFPVLNDMTLGLGKGQLILVIAATSMGKSAFMLDVARHLGYSQDVPVAFFSCEMTNEENKQRMCCTICEVSYVQAVKGYVNSDQKEFLYEAERQINMKPIYMDKTPGLTPSALKRKMANCIRKHGIKVAFVDHLHNMKPDRQMERRPALAHISKDIKDIATDFEIPVVLGAQVNRSVATRDNRRPCLHDIRDCGEVEEAADQVWGLYRPSYYGEEGDDELLQLKGRNCGMGGVVPLMFNKELASFQNPF